MKKSVLVVLMSVILTVLLVSLAVSYEFETWLDPDESDFDEISEFRQPVASRTDIDTNECSGDFVVSFEVDGGGTNYIAHSVENGIDHYHWFDGVMNLCSADVSASYIDGGDADGTVHIIFQWPY